MGTCDDIGQPSSWIAALSSEGWRCEGGTNSAGYMHPGMEFKWRLTNHAKSESDRNQLTGERDADFSFVEFIRWLEEVF